MEVTARQNTPSVELRLAFGLVVDVYFVETQMMVYRYQVELCVDSCIILDALGVDLEPANLDTSVQSKVVISLSPAILNVVAIKALG